MVMSGVLRDARVGGAPHGNDLVWREDSISGGLRVRQRIRSTALGGIISSLAAHRMDALRKRRMFRRASSGVARRTPSSLWGNPGQLNMLRHPGIQYHRMERRETHITMNKREIYAKNRR
jgi:hypothetical protein